MTIQEKIGQMMVFGWQGENPPEANNHARNLIQTCKVGGIILFARNIESPEQIRHTVAELQTLAKKTGLPPLFVCIDQEGGRVSRLQSPQFPQFPAARDIGSTHDTSKARDNALSIANVLKPLGINWNFAPVLDIDNNPANPIIGERSFGDNPELVAAMGVAAIKGFQEDGQILSCGKHFPGHGDTDKDSHYALPTIVYNKTRLDQVELVPFHCAIEAGVGAIMSAHILFSALDPSLPATLSPRILTGVLRDELGFNGLIVTDCLQMKGVAEKWGTPEAAVLAVLAGADILLCCHTWEEQIALHDNLVHAVETNRITEARIDSSLKRIAESKARWIS